MERLQIKESLKESMQKEVNLMREVLTNLFQEESSLFQHHPNSETFFIQDRFPMIEKLKLFKIHRETAIQNLITLSPENEKNVPIFEFLFSNDDDSCEILLLIDQLIALTDKINEQHMRNQNLSQQIQHLVAFTNTLPYPTQTGAFSTSKKKTLATLLRDENENRY